MTILFPSALDTFTNPAAADKLNSATVPHATQHANVNDAIEAMEAMLVGPAWVNVMAYGASPTASAAANTAAFLAAIAAAMAMGGGMVYVPAGTYQIAASISLGVAHNRLTLEGEQGTIIENCGTGKAIVLEPGANNITLRNFEVVGSSSTDDGIYISRDTMFWTLDRLTVTKCSQAGKAGIHIDGAYIGTLNNCLCGGESGALANDIGILIDDAAGQIASQVSLVECTAMRNTSVNLKCDTANAVRLIGGTFSDSPGNGIVVTGGGGFSVLGSNIESNVGIGLQMDGVAGFVLDGPDIGSNGTGLELTGNTYAGVLSAPRMAGNGVDYSLGANVSRVLWAFPEVLPSSLPNRSVVISERGLRYNSGAVPGWPQLAAQANNVELMSLVASAAGNLALAFDVAFENSAWIAKNDTVAWVKKVADQLRISGSGGNVVGNAASAGSTWLALDVVYGNLGLGTTSPGERLSLKTHDNYAGSEVNKSSGATQTVGAATATLYYKGLSDNRIYHFDVRITARRTDAGPECGAYWRRFAVYREAGGDATLVAAAQTPAADIVATLAAAVEVDCSGTDVRVRVTGETGKTVAWVANVEYQAVASSS